MRDATAYGGSDMRLAKYLAHAGRRLAARGRAADRRRARDASTARSSPIRRATSASASRVARRRRAARRARAARRLRPAQARRRRLDGARHARPPDRRRARAARGPAPVPGRAPGRRQHRPDPADQRRRARQPAHAPALRGAEDLPRARRRRAGRRAARCARCATGVELDDGLTAPARVRRARAGRARADDPRGPQAPGAAHVRGGRASGASSCGASRFGPLRLGGLRAGRAPAPDARREVERCCARSDRIAAPMRLFALRGATSVERNDAQDDPRRDRRADARDPGSATRSRPRTSSAASSRHRTTSTPSSRPSPRARSGFERVPLLCAREIAVPRRAAARDPRADPLLRRGGPRAQHVYLGEAARCAPTCRPRSRRVAPRRLAPGSARHGTMRMPSSSQSASGASPSTPSPAATPRRRRWCALASNESPYPPLPRCARRSSARSATLNRYPDPSNSLLRRRLSDRYGVPAVADRDRQRLLRHPAGRRRGAARAGRRARLRVAVVLGLPAPRRRLGRARDHGRRSTSDDRHDLPAMLREITVATRLVIVCNPNNPTSTALPLAEIADFVAEVPAARVRDRRRGLLRVQPARRPRRLDRPARAPPEPRAAAHVLQGLRPVRAARRLRAVRLGGPAARRSTRCASRSSATRSRRPRRSRRSPTRTRCIDRVDAQRRRAHRGRRAACARSGIEPAESQANFCWFDARRRARRGSEVMRGLRERGVLVRGGAALGRAPARCA